jgi:hypothetical protein
MPYLRYYLEDCRKRYVRGDRAALLEALDFWLACCIGPPAWIAHEFHAAWAEWLRGSELSDAFGVKQPRGQHHESQRERMRLVPRIMFQVEVLRQQGMPLDVRLFSIAGADIGKSASYVRDQYYDEANAGLRRMLERMRVTSAR